MEKIPQFVREFSKQQSPEDRQKTAQEIKAERAEHFGEKKSNLQRQEELKSGLSEREKALQEQLQKIEQLKSQLEEISSSTLGKLFNYFKLKKLRADLAIGQHSFEELSKVQESESTEEGDISAKLSPDNLSPHLQESRKMLDNFYRGQKEKWSTSEYTKEDITKYFSEENLCKLSSEDYALLLKRFPSEMVAHVTRQGIRDHLGHMFHTAGEGAYADGFMKIAEDGRLRSPLGVYLAEGYKDDKIADFLKLKNFENKEEALKYLETLTGERHQGDPGSYSDRMAIHFATEEVVDCYYGSEQGNEIFIAYPSAYIASQYYFNGQLNKAGGGYWNDQWVWANEERGMDLNAGLVFIPKDAKVDAETGSRYELDENRNPVLNEEYIQKTNTVLNSQYFESFRANAEAILGEFNQDWTDDNLTKGNKELRNQLEPLRKKLEEEFGVSDVRLQRAILDYQFLFKYPYVKREENSGLGVVETTRGLIEYTLKNRGILYAEAKDTISSEEFWENYFSQHPNRRPSKIVYYKGGVPTIALYDWLKEHKFEKESKDKNIGFSERNIERNTPIATAGLERFRSIAEKVIEDFFAKKS